MSYDNWKTTEPIDAYDVPECDERIDDEIVDAFDDWEPDADFVAWCDEQDAIAQAEAASDYPAGIC